MKKFITIDCEGDGLHRDTNQKLFPNANHFDKNTRIWCVTFCNGIQCVTFFKKLPDEEHRRFVVLDDGTTWGRVRSFHEADSKPFDYSQFTDFRDYTDKTYKEYLQAIADFMIQGTNLNYNFYFKSYNGYKYDEDLLRVNFEKHSINITCNDDQDCLSNMQGVSCTLPKHQDQWDPSMGKIPNELFMNMGIKHNIEDSRELHKVWSK